MSAVGALADPTRRSVYRMVSDASGPVGRDEVAGRLGMARQTAAYHLDRLAAEGLLEVEYVRLTGRTGPGAGRPAKTYRRSTREYEVSVPPRSYLLAARILLEAVRTGAVDRDDIAVAARRVGSELGRAGLDPALQETGYELAEEDGVTRFRNCPFHSLKEQDTAVTCSLNLALVEGMAEAAGDPRHPVLRPEPGYCCVALEPPSPRGAGPAG